MVTGSSQTKHKRYYSCLNFYPNGTDAGRKTKWIPTGLPERGNKRNADQITDHLKTLFNPDGSIISKYDGFNDIVGKIANDIPLLPEVTLDSLRKMLNEMPVEQNLRLEKSIFSATTTSTILENPESIRKMLFCDYMVRWLERISSTIDKTTYGSYKALVHGRIFNYFNELDINVEDVKPGHIEDFYRFLSKEFDLAQNSIIHYHNLIRHSLQQLFKKQIIINNPADLIDNRPVRSIPIFRFYGANEINKYLHIIKGTKMEMPVYLASYYGFTRSEVLGVNKNNIDFINNEIRVRHVVTKANIDGHIEIIRKDRTKNKFRLRTMPLLEDVKTVILEAYERHEYYRKACGSLYYQKDKHYLCLDEMGHLLKPDYISHRHKELLEKHNLPHIRFHDLRHSCASLLLSKGIPIEKIKEWLGHSDINTTMRYAHMIISDAKMEMADVLSDSIIMT